MGQSLRGETGADLVEDILTDPDSDCVAHFVNYSEVYTWFMKQSSEADAQQAIADLESAGIAPRYDSDPIFWKTVAKHRAVITSTIKNPATGGKHSIAIADCFVIALALKLGGQAITSDHGEFDYIQTSGTCPVFFFR